MAYNFDLNVMDELRLPCAVNAAAEGDGEVTFGSRSEAASYLRGEIRQWVSAQTVTTPDPLSEAPLSKKDLFEKEGRALADTLRTGLSELDANVECVRLDRLVHHAHAVTL